MALSEEKAAYVVGILATVLGWQITHITDDIQSTRSVAYWIEDASTKAPTVVIENVSKEKSLANATFLLSCMQHPNCIRRGSVNIVAYAPTLANVTPEENPALDEAATGAEAQIPINDITINTTMAAGGRIGLRYSRMPGLSDPEFFFVPDEQKPVDILVIEGRSIRGLAVRYYFELMGAIFALLLLALAIIVTHMLRAKVKSRRRVRRKPRTTELPLKKAAESKNDTGAGPVP